MLNVLTRQIIINLYSSLCTIHTTYVRQSTHVVLFTIYFISPLAKKSNPHSTMGKKSKSDFTDDKPKPKSLLAATLKPDAQSVKPRPKLPKSSTSATKPTTTPPPGATAQQPNAVAPPQRFLGNVQMPASDDGITASDLNQSQKTVVKRSVQNIFRKNTFGEGVDKKPYHTLINATQDLAKLMEAAAAKRKQQQHHQQKGSKN